MNAPVRGWLRPGMLGWHIFAVIVVGVCVFAGFWQLGVYDSQQTEEREANAARPAVAMADVWGPDDPIRASLLDRKVTFDGTFADAHDQAWVSGKNHDGREGYWLLAPVHVNGGDTALLVVRGWAFDAGELPDVPSGTQELTVILQQGEAQVSPLDADRVIGSVRVPALLNEYDYDLYSGYGIQIGPPVHASGLSTADPPDPDVSWTTGLRNLAYAIQWWAFGIFAVFMWWRMGRDMVSDRHARDSGDVRDRTRHDGNAPVA